MQKIMVGFRVLLESTLLWLGGCVLLMYLASAAVSAAWLKPLLSDGGNAFIIGTGVLLAAAIIWIITARKKEMGDRLQTNTYVLLNLLALVLPGMIVWQYLHSFD